MVRILVGAADGVHVFEDGRERAVERVGWPDGSTAITALVPSSPSVWAVVDRHEIWRTEDIGSDEWTHVASVLNLDVECLADTRAGVLVGTSAAHLCRVVDPPTPIETVEAFERVEGRDGWYTPWGGPPSVRSISEDADAVYVNVHVGGIGRSVDRGATWEPTIDVDADVHRVWAGVPGVFAACALGLAVSEDRGGTWRVEDDGLHATYCRGVTVCGDTVLLSASNGPRGGRAALYRRPVRGGAFERCRAGLPEWFDANVDSAWLDATPDLAAFGTADGRVFASTDEGAGWSEVASGLPSIGAVFVMP